AIGDPPAFSVAGTIYDDPVDLDGEDGVNVVVTDSLEHTCTATTNEVGNFYLTPEECSPTFPLVTITVALLGATPITMQSDSGRSGGCATCHVAPAGP